MSDNELSDRHKAFCIEYLANGFNGKQAAIKAGYSEISATSTASEILTYPNVRSFLDKSVDLMLGDKKELTKKLIDKWCDITFYINPGLPEDAVYKPNEILKASELLGKYLTLFVEKKEIDLDMKTQVIFTQQDVDLL